MDAEHIGYGTLQVVSVEAGDEDFAFLVENEDARDHYFEGTGGDGDEVTVGEAREGGLAVRVRP